MQANVRHNAPCTLGNTNLQPKQLIGPLLKGCHHLIPIHQAWTPFIWDTWRWLFKVIVASLQPHQPNRSTNPTNGTVADGAVGLQVAYDPLRRGTKASSQATPECPCRTIKAMVVYSQAPAEMVFCVVGITMNTLQCCFIVWFPCSTPK